LFNCHVLFPSDATAFLRRLLDLARFAFQLTVQKFQEVDAFTGIHAENVLERESFRTVDQMEDFFA